MMSLGVRVVSDFYGFKGAQRFIFWVGASLSFRPIIS